MASDAPQTTPTWTKVPQEDIERSLRERAETIGDVEVRVFEGRFQWRPKLVTP